ncbi:hypothetical protein ABT215_11140 [Streptomyces sp900105755]|uniref:hypothetical protein n=1 Tax=Streptomyces sp. 900105755 TaxID=3154389 RepID=UPI0033199CB6
MNHTDPTETARPLRDRIAEALATADGWKWAPGFKEHSPTWRDYQRRADAVLAVLLPPTDRAAVLLEAADWYARQGKVVLAASQVAADLRRRAAEVEQEPTDADVVEAHRLALSFAVDAAETQQPECSASISGNCLREAQSETACDTDDGECVYGGRPAAETQQTQTETRDAPPADIQVWPLQRILTEVRCGSQDWTWDEEWADLDEYHAARLAWLETEIRANGITSPVLIGSDGRLWDGHHRLRIAVRADIGYVPVEIVPAAAPAVPVEAAADDEETTS